MISKLAESLPTGASVVFTKHYRDQPNKVKFIANFSGCHDMLFEINSWLVHSLCSMNVEYSKIRESEVTVIISF